MVPLCLTGKKGENETEEQINKWVTKKRSWDWWNPSIPPPHCTHPSCPRESWCLLNSPQPAPSGVIYRLFHCVREGRDLFKSAWKSLEKRACLRGALEAKTPGRVAWGPSLLSLRRIYHYWTLGFLVSLETLSTCVGVKVGRVKISFISYKKNSPLCKVAVGAKASPLLIYMFL